MNHQSNSQRRGNRQQGFSLLEALLGLGILGLIAAGLSFGFDGSSSKGKAAYAMAAQLGVAQTVFAANTSCFATSPAVLSKPGLAAGTGTYCNRDVNARWRGPYIPDDVDELVGSTSTRVIKDVRFSFNRYLGTRDFIYAVEADNMTYLQARAFILACLGRDFQAADFVTDHLAIGVALERTPCVVNTDLATDTENNNVKVTLRFAQRRN